MVSPFLFPETASFRAKLLRNGYGPDRASVGLKKKVLKEVTEVGF